MSSAAPVQSLPPCLKPTTRLKPRPMTSRVKGITIMWACRSANKKVKKGNSVMWKDTSGASAILSGTQKARGEGWKLSRGGNIRLLRQKSKAATTCSG